MHSRTLILLALLPVLAHSYRGAASDWQATLELQRPAGGNDPLEGKLSLSREHRVAASGASASLRLGSDATLGQSALDTAWSIDPWARAHLTAGEWMITLEGGASVRSWSDSTDFSGSFQISDGLAAEAGGSRSWFGLGGGLSRLSDRYLDGRAGWSGSLSALYYSTQLCASRLWDGAADFTPQRRSAWNPPTTADQWRIVSSSIVERNAGPVSASLYLEGAASWYDAGSLRSPGRTDSTTGTFRTLTFIPSVKTSFQPLDRLDFTLAGGWTFATSQGPLHPSTGPWGSVKLGTWF